MPVLAPILSTKLQNEISRISAIFTDAGASWIEAPTLLSAEIMLDLYGEAIRDHAYIVHDAIEGDFVLRPDFTVPLVEAHMNDGAEPARYAYSGRVWRKGNALQNRHSSWQMGFELFDRGDVAINDAEIFKLAFDIAGHRNFTLETGDLGLIFSLLDLLEMAQWRRDALKRHVWRPKAFANLLDRFSMPSFTPINLKLPDNLPVSGLRSREMIEARLERLAQEAHESPIDNRIKSLILDIFRLNGTLAITQTDLAKLAKSNPIITPLAHGFSARIDAFLQRSIAPECINFDAGFGRESMEYYDGFVFGFKNAKGETAISGGRYDRLTEILGKGRRIPAIGVACNLELLAGEL